MADSSITNIERVIRPRKGLFHIGFAELWLYRELFLFLTLRDVLIRYKQTALGILWAVLQPFLTMVVFTIIFGRLAKMPSGGAPYAVMTFAALLPWQYFANALTQSSQSVVGAAGMVRKVYFPRLIIPASTTLSGTVDFVISLVMLFGLMLWYGVPFRLHLLLLPVFFLCAAAAALSAGFWFSALNVKYRDVKFVVPFLVRIGMYVCPVGFMSSVVPERWRFWYSLNPLVGIIDGFRWAILGPQFVPDWPGFVIGMAVVAVLFISGLIYFSFTAKTFDDII